MPEEDHDIFLWIGFTRKRLMTLWYLAWNDLHWWDFTRSFRFCGSAICATFYVHNYERQTVISRRWTTFHRHTILPVMLGFLHKWSRIGSKATVKIKRSHPELHKLRTPANFSLLMIICVSCFFAKYVNPCRNLHEMFLFCFERNVVTTKWIKLIITASNSRTIYTASNDLAFFNTKVYSQTRQLLEIS